MSNRSAASILLLCAAAAASAAPASARADVTVYSDRVAFLAASSATAEAPIPDVGLVGRRGASITVGDLTYFDSPTDEQAALIMTEFTPLIPGNDIALSSFEYLDVVVNHAVYALGSDFAEGTDSPLSCNALCPCHDTTFQVTLLLGASVVGSFTFNAPDDELSFVGVISDSPFDRVEYRDLSGACDNEYWGQFYTSDSPPPPRCPCDWNGVDGLDSQDFFDFLDGFFNGDADFNGFDGTDSQDYFDFLECFFNGC